MESISFHLSFLTAVFEAHTASETVSVSVENSQAVNFEELSESTTNLLELPHNK
jgi:hypothetical protein